MTSYIEDRFACSVDALLCFILFSPFYFNQRDSKRISNCCNPPIKHVLSIGE